MFDHNKLIGKVIEVFLTRGAYGEAMGWSNVTLSKKLNSTVLFTQEEIRKSIDLLGIKEEEIIKYFFNKKV